jgi:hypothetical protein
MHNKGKIILAMGGIIAAYVLSSFFMSNIIDEDAFIYFRCAENILQGSGYVFNQGGEKIEACSSATWLLLLVLFRWLGFNIIIAAKILGIILGVVSLVLIYLVTRNFLNDMPWAVVPSLLTALTPPFILWNQMGLETSLYTATLLLLVLICMNDAQFFWSWPVVALFLIATRPEGFFLVLGLTSAFYFLRVQKKELRYSTLFFLCGAFCLLATRFFYFHDFLPSPFYHKIQPGKYKMGIQYIHHCFRDYYLYAFIIPALFFIFKKWNWGKRRFILFGFNIIYLLWVIIAGSDYKPFYRHMVPVLPLLYIYIITGVLQALAAAISSRNLLSVGYVIIAAVAIFLFSPVQWYFEDRIEHFGLSRVNDFLAAPERYICLCVSRFTEPVKYDYNGELDTQILLGEFIKKNYTPGAVLVYDQMGRVPYWAGTAFCFIDSNGLTDRVIARAEFYEKSKESLGLRLYELVSRYLVSWAFCKGACSYFAAGKKELLDYIFSKNPDAILCFAPMRTMIINYLGHDQRFKNNYCLKFGISGVLIFEKNDIARKQLNIPKGLSIKFQKHLAKDPYIRNHPLVSGNK